MSCLPPPKNHRARRGKRLGSIEEIAAALADNLPAPKPYGKSRRRRRKKKRGAQAAKPEQGAARDGKPPEQTARAAAASAETAPAS